MQEENEKEKRTVSEQGKQNDDQKKEEGESPNSRMKDG